MEKQQKIIEELQRIESFAEMLLEKCYSVRELLSLGGVHPRASIKKKSQSKINQVIANRNKSLRKLKDILVLILAFTFSAPAQHFPLPSYDSVCGCIDTYYHRLNDSQIEEFRYSSKNRWLNYIPSPGYSPFTGGFTVSLNLSAPLQEAKFRQQVNRKIRSISKANDLQATTLKNQAKAEIKALQNAIFEYNLLDSLEYLKQKAFALVSTQYNRNEITPSEFLSKQMEHKNFLISRLTTANAIEQKIFELLIKFKCPVP